MYKVEVKNACRCFFKSGYLEEQDFNTKEEAKKEAEAMFKVINSTFCHQHLFSLLENDDSFTITISSKAKPGKSL